MGQQNTMWTLRRRESDLNVQWTLSRTLVHMSTAPNQGSSVSIGLQVSTALTNNQVISVVI